MAWLTNWNYRKAVTISNAGSALLDYQTSITVDTLTLVNAGKMQSDCGDIRFTDTDGSTPLQYWIESGQNTASTKIWAKIPSVPIGTKTIYLYYGNIAATYDNSIGGTNTFLFFDDFSGGTLDATKWTRLNGNTPTFANNEMTFVGSVNQRSRIIATGGSQENNYVLRAKFKVTGGSNTDEQLGLGVKVSTSTGQGYNYVLYDQVSRNYLYFLNDAVTWGTGYSYSWLANTWYTEEIYHDGTKVVGKFNDGTANFQSWSGRSGYLALNGGYYGATTVWDWAFIRPYASPEPTFSALGTEQTPPNITATNMTITPSETPCRVGICTVTVVVRWSNGGGTDGSVIPNITIDTVPQIAHTSRTVLAGSYIDEAFAVSGLSAGIHTICPYPN